MYHLITKDNCVWCDRAKRLIQDKGNEFVAYHYEEHPMMKKLMFKADLKTVPQIWYNGTYIGGYEEIVNWFEEL